MLTNTCDTGKNDGQGGYTDLGCLRYEYGPDTLFV